LILYLSHIFRVKGNPRVSKCRMCVSWLSQPAHFLCVEGELIYTNPSYLE
jgi:hypothetical protein